MAIESFENEETTGASAGIVDRKAERAKMWLGGSGGLHANRDKPGYREFLREIVNLRKITELPGAEEIEKKIELAQREKIENWDAASMRDELDEIILPSMEEMGKELKEEIDTFGEEGTLTQEDEELLASQQRKEVRTRR
jgi:hypothetical protein